MLDKENGVSMTLMFRVVQKAIAVKPATAAVVDGKAGGEGAKKRKMDVATAGTIWRTEPGRTQTVMNDTGQSSKKSQLALTNMANKHLIIWILAIDELTAKKKWSSQQSCNR